MREQPDNGNVSCGKVLLGGGGEVTNSDTTRPDRVQLNSSQPASTTSWAVTAKLGGSFVMTVTAVAVCTCEASTYKICGSFEQATGGVR